MLTSWKLSDLLNFMPTEQNLGYRRSVFGLSKPIKNYLNFGLNLPTVANTTCSIKKSIWSKVHAVAWPVKLVYPNSSFQKWNDRLNYEVDIAGRPTGLRSFWGRLCGGSSINKFWFLEILDKNTKKKCTEKCSSLILAIGLLLLHFIWLMKDIFISEL